MGLPPIMGATYLIIIRAIHIPKNGGLLNLVPKSSESTQHSVRSRLDLKETGFTYRSFTFILDQSVP